MAHHERAVTQFPSLRQTGSRPQRFSLFKMGFYTLSLSLSLFLSVSLFLSLPLSLPLSLSISPSEEYSLFNILFLSTLTHEILHQHTDMDQMAHVEHTLPFSSSLADNGVLFIWCLIETHRKLWKSCGELNRKGVIIHLLYATPLL